MNHDNSPSIHDASFRAHDGAHLYGWLHAAGKPERADLILVHGYAEHSGRYRDLAARFSERGYAVRGYDHRGHGKSEGRAGYIERFGVYADDLAALIDTVRSDRPLFLLGHSMGGAVCLDYLLRNPDNGVRGLILSSPMIRLVLPLPRFLAPMLAALGRLFPHMPTASLQRQYLSRSPEVRQNVRQDPLSYHGPTPAATAAAFLREEAHLEERAEQIDLPLLLIHGDADRITSFEGSEAYFRRTASLDKTFIRLPGYYHETFRDPGGEAVVEQMLGWLDGRAP